LEGKLIEKQTEIGEDGETVFLTKNRKLGGAGGLGSIQYQMIGEDGRMKKVRWLRWAVVYVAVPISWNVTTLAGLYKYAEESE